MKFIWIRLPERTHKSLYRDVYILYAGYAGYVGYADT